MEAVLRSLRRAAQDMLAPRIIALALWPMGIALLLWGGLAWVFGAAWRSGIEGFLAVSPLQDFVLWAGAEWLPAYAALFILVLLWLPAVYVTALLITSLALMPFIVAHVAARYYPALEPHRGGGFVESAMNGVTALLIYLAAWLLLLPVWLFAPFGLAVTVLLNAWINQRMFLYDALSEHASADELGRLRHAGGWDLYALAALLVLPTFVPFLNFLAPVYMGLAFTHFGLDRLDRARRVPAGTPA